jgi:hypothetical protein
LWQDASGLENVGASIFTQRHSLHPEDGGSKVLRNVRRNPEDLDFNLHSRENISVA